MSDFQLLSGLSMLIAGYTQLRCGLQVYHWIKLVYMVWFSSVTHLACLTFLRQYLHRHEVRRLWRVLAMSILIILLIVALLPTGSLNIPARSYTNTHAICFFTQSLQEHTYSADPKTSRQYMIISMLLLSLGMLNRVIRMYPKSTRLLHAITRFGRSVFSDYLQKIESCCIRRSTFSRLARSLLFLPSFSAFVVSRSLVDLWSSMAFEVMNTLETFPRLIFFVTDQLCRSGGSL